MKLVVTIDVEEEGLFSGRYDPFEAPTTNVSSLKLLNDLFLKWKIHPTLLVTYQVAKQPAWRQFLIELAENWGAEIGAHLHHWNTPPIFSSTLPGPVPSENIPTQILREKLNTLLEAFEPMKIIPRSFRMGRFSFGPKMFKLLSDSPIIVDSSVAPMRIEYGGPDHLDAPVDPYFLNPTNIASRGDSQLLEVPITIVPIFPRIGHLLKKMQGSRKADKALGWVASRLCSFPAQPAWTDISRLKIASALHIRRGGKVLTLFFHSSEVAAGHSPFHPTSKEVAFFIEKLDAFFSWLNNRTTLESLTLHQLRETWN